MSIAVRSQVCNVLTAYDQVLNDSILSITI